MKYAASLLTVEALNNRIILLNSRLSKCVENKIFVLFRFTVTVYQKLIHLTQAKEHKKTVYVKK